MERKVEVHFDAVSAEDVPTIIIEAKPDEPLCEEPETVDQDELQLKDEMNTAWVKAWRKALKKT